MISRLNIFQIPYPKAAILVFCSQWNPILNLNEHASVILWLWLFITHCLISSTHKTINWRYPLRIISLTDVDTIHLVQHLLHFFSWPDNCRWPNWFCLSHWICIQNLLLINVCAIDCLACWERKFATSLTIFRFKTNKTKWNIFYKIIFEQWW